MKARDDLDRGAVSEILESVKRKVQNEGTLIDEPESSIFSRLPAEASLLSRLAIPNTK